MCVKTISHSCTAKDDNANEHSRVFHCSHVCLLGFTLAVRVVSINTEDLPVCSRLFVKTRLFCLVLGFEKLDCFGPAPRCRDVTSFRVTKFILFGRCVFSTADRQTLIIITIIIIIINVLQAHCHSSSIFSNNNFLQTYLAITVWRGTRSPANQTAILGPTWCACG